MDKISTESRSKIMRSVKSSNTSLEKQIFKQLRIKGIRFRKHVKTIYGKPDIVFTKERVVVFIDSCFWHKCRYHYRQPKTKTEYWIPKIDRNVTRAKEVNKKLKSDGWIVLRIWEHSIQKNLTKCIDKIINYI